MGRRAAAREREKGFGRRKLGATNKRNVQRKRCFPQARRARVGSVRFGSAIRVVAERGRGRDGGGETGTAWVGSFAEEDGPLQRRRWCLGGGRGEAKRNVLGGESVAARLGGFGGHGGQRSAQTGQDALLAVGLDRCVGGQPHATTIILDWPPIKVRRRTSP